MIDVHAHFWPEGLLSALRAGVPWYGWEGVRLADGRQVLARGDRLVRFTPPAQDLASLDARISARAETAGVHVEIVQPVGFLWGEHLHGVELHRYLAELNQEIAAAQQAAPGRIRGVGMLPWHDPTQFDDGLEAVVDAGLEVVAIPTNVDGRNLDAPTVLPLVERVLDAGLAGIVHPTYLTPVGQERFPRYYFANSFGAPLEAALALLSLVQAGVLERYASPRLLIVNGAGCAPGEIGRFDRRYHERSDARTMPSPPSHYLDRVFYDALVLDAATLRLLIERVGVRQVALGTDHPFRSDVPEGAGAWIEGMPWLSDEDRDELRWGTAERFLGLRLRPDVRALGA